MINISPKSLMFLLLFFLLKLNSINAQPAVAISLIVQDVEPDSRSITFTIGIDPNATLGFDTGLDQFYPPPSPAGLDAALLLQTDFTRVQADIQGGDLPFYGHKDYKLFVKPGSATNTIKLEIDFPSGVSGGSITSIENDIVLLPGFNSVIAAAQSSGGSLLTIGVDFDGITKVNLIGGNDELTTTFRLFQNYPNPFNPETIIKYEIASPPSLSTYKGEENREGMFISLIVYNSLGQEIARLVNGFQSPGIHEEIFNGENLKSGIYFYELRSNGLKQIRKMILMK